MTIPKSILKSSSDNVNLIPKHVNFESQADESEQETYRLIESLASTSRDLVSKELKRFLKGNWDLDHQGEDYLFDKMLLEFPIFALNDDYLKSMANIVHMKID